MGGAIDITGRAIDFECMSCDIANHKIIPPGGMIYEDEFCTLAADVEVPIVGFIILAPKRHVVSINELTNVERYHLLHMINESINALKALRICDSVEIFQEETYHMHIWILPRHAWMVKEKLSAKSAKLLFKTAKNKAAENGVYDVLLAVQKLKTYFKDYKPENTKI